MRRFMSCAGALLALSLAACGGSAPGAGDAAAEAGGPGDGGAADTGFSATQPDGRCIEGAYPKAPSGVCECQADAPDACQTGCTDLKNDDDNCGACGRACDAGATCRVGVCGPAPATVVAAPATCGAMALVVANDALYWTDTAGGHVSTMPAAGGASVAVSGAETTAPTLLHINGTTVFWLDGKTIRKNAGGSISDVYTNLDDIHGLTTSDDGATVYFSSGAKIQSVPASGGATAVDVEVHNSGNPMALAIEGDFLASVVALAGGVNVIRLDGPLALCWTMDPTDGSIADVNCRRTAQGQGELNTYAVLATDSKVVWLDGPNIKAGDLAATMNGGWDSVTTSDANVSSITAVNGRLFFGSFDGQAGAGTIAQAPLMPNVLIPLRLARIQHDPRSIGVAGQRVFWMTDDCEIQSVATGN